MGEAAQARSEFGFYVELQQAHHLRPTGIVNWAVSQALRAAAAGVETTSTPIPLPVGSRARLVGGQAVAPASAPPAVKAAIAAANQIATRPYVYGGGHGSFISSGYDCSGSVSYALHGGGLIHDTEDSSQLESYGGAGPGRWITIYANAGHAYMIIAGLRFDTSAQSSTARSPTRRKAPHRSSPAPTMRSRASSRPVMPRPPAGRRIRISQANGSE